MLAQLLSLNALAALLNFAQWSRMLPIFFCAMCMGYTRVERGLYDLTPEGAAALARWAPRALTQK